MEASSSHIAYDIWYIGLSGESRDLFFFYNTEQRFAHIHLLKSIRWLYGKRVIQSSAGDMHTYRDVYRNIMKFAGALRVEICILFVQATFRSGRDVRSTSRKISCYFQASA